MPYEGYPDDRGLRYPVAFVYSVVVALLWIPAFVLRRLGRSFRELGAENWPQANGSITACNVRVIHGWILDYALGQLDYCYSAAGEYYAGSMVRQYPDEQAAWSFVDSRRDKAIVVRYKDDNAQASVVLDADQQPFWCGNMTPSFCSMVWHHWRDEVGEIEEPTQMDENQSEQAATVPARESTQKP